MEGYKPLTLKPANIETQAQAVYGEAYAAAPAARMRAVEAARAAFDVRARDRGLSADILGQSRDEFRRALQEAAGAVFENGEQYGGVGRFNGRRTIVPANVSAERFGRLVEAITDADLAANGPIGSNGQPLRARDLRGAQLVAIGANRYRVARGDPDGDRPQWFMNRQGDVWELNFDALETTLRNRRPDLYRGGSAAPFYPPIAADSP
jgi:hypothetical protein